MTKTSLAFGFVFGFALLSLVSAGQARAAAEDEPFIVVAGCAQRRVVVHSRHIAVVMPVVGGGRAKPYAGAAIGTFRSLA